MTLIPQRARSCAIAALLSIAATQPRAVSLAQEGRPAQYTELGAVTHFAQGWPVETLVGAKQIGVNGIRDSLPWGQIETTPGVYDFSGDRSAYLDELGDTSPVTIVFNQTNELYDDGYTPYTDAGRQAAAHFIVAALDRYPNISAVEVGNEFNGQNFISGPVHDAPYSEKAHYYIEILKAIYETVKATHPDVKVLGGAAHSIPVGYFQQLFERGALNYMDGIVIHPYTSAPEQVADHVAILNAAMGPDRVPIYATEVGQEVDDPQEAANYLIKMVSALAASDIAAIHWYALREQPYYRNMGLLDMDLGVRPAGRAFQLIQTLLQSAGNPRDVSPDAMTYAYQYGDHALVLWGEPRTIALAPGISALDATGDNVDTSSLMLDPGQPLVLLGGAQVTLGDTVILGPQRLIADSFHQFDWSNDPAGPERFEGPWSYSLRSGTGALEELETEPGGTVSSEAWHPYIGHDQLRPLAVSDRRINPVDFADGQDPAQQYAVVERYVSDRRQSVDIEGRWQVNVGSEDGIVLSVTVDGQSIYETTSRSVISLELTNIELLNGSIVEFVVGTNGNARGGDSTQRRIRIMRRE